MTKRHLCRIALVLVSMLTGACGEAAAEVEPAAASAAPTTAAQAPAPAPAAPAAPSDRLAGSWDAFAGRAVLSVVAEQGQLRLVGRPGADTYTIVGEGDSVTLHTVDEAGVAEDSPLHFFGANAATQGAPPRDMLMLRSGVDMQTDPAALGLHGSWLWEGMTYTFGPEGAMSQGDATRHTEGRYRVLEVGTDGVLVAHWLVLEGGVAIGHSLARLARTGDTIVWTYLPSGETRTLTRVTTR